MDKRQFRNFILNDRAEDRERVRLNILNDPSRIPQNDLALLAPTRIKCLKAFFLHGKPIVAGEIITLESHDAASLAAIGKVELV